ncbi:ATP-dependent DNA ligase [Psychrobacillus sp. FSL H8-0510]|uniref:ATP-dependent DNA ligase n=1 Tax=Psychrobacillus sp. FSL H8-0510 TaxID=2921394 RepID=UPI0030FD0D44
MFVSPMLLQKSTEPIDEITHITELKLDGIRTIWTKFDNRVRIYTRHNNEITSKFPELANLSLPNGTVLDGEIIVTNELGKPDFEALMERFMSKSSEHAISFSVFDILYFNGKRITSYPLLERKEMLATVVTEDSPLLNKVQWVEGNGTAYFELIKQHKLEGIVQKKSNSRYQINKRSDAWLKIISYQYDTVYIAGLRKDKFGLLLNFENGKYAGVLEFMTTKNRHEFYSHYKDFILEENEKYIYLDPKMRAKIKYRNLTKNGLLRIPSFVEWS